MGHNDIETPVNTRETTSVVTMVTNTANLMHYRVVDDAWMLLRKHLLSNNEHVKYQLCVARRIVTMGGTLPQWLIDPYKVNKCFL